MKRSVIILIAVLVLLFTGIIWFETVQDRKTQQIEDSIPARFVKVGKIKIESNDAYSPYVYFYIYEDKETGIKYMGRPSNFNHGTGLTRLWDKDD